MAPSFFSLKEFRRRSRASFRTDRSTDTSSNDDPHGNDITTPPSGANTPPSIAAQSDPALHMQLKDNHVPPVPPIPLRPNLSKSSRHSVSGMTGLGSPSASRVALPMSQYAPRVTNVNENSWVSQKVLIISGTIGEPSRGSLDGSVTVSRLDDSFPPTSWPVCDSHFKSLAYLSPGANRLRIEFSSPKLANSGSSNNIHASYLTVHMVPSTNAPPLQLAVLVGKDSPGTFDAVPARVEREGNGLETAIRKYRMAAYLWQAFTAEQMWRNQMGRRVFRFEEEWISGTSNQRDREMGTMRSEARIHIVRTEKTVAELRDLQRAQQNKQATKKGELFDIAGAAVRNYFKPLPGQKLHVSVLLLDSHWDTASQTVTGHAALGTGGNGGDLQLAIFGSHCLQSYPSSFEEVAPAFSDCTPTDTKFVANDCNNAGSSWEAANIGIGAHLHETGHLFGCPHQESGVMLQDYVRFNRSFLSREAYSTRTKSKGGLVTQADECTWHRLDCLRFRTHPSFRLPNDPILNPDSSVQAWPVGGGQVVVTAATGVSWIEIYPAGDDVCHTWIEYGPENGHVQRNVALKESELRERLPEKKRRLPIKVRIFSHGGGDLEISDFSALCSKESSFKLSFGKSAFRSNKLGHSGMKGSEPIEFLFTSSVHQNRVLSRIQFYHGLALDGLEFVYDDESTQLFGKRGGKPGGDVFEMDIRRGEYITGFFVRSGAWIDGIQVLTSLGRKSPIYGNAHGGSPHTLLPPRGYNLIGVAGSCAEWVDGFQLIITR